jgi:leucyl aminopeptidase (aminopeptidase T)
LFVDLRYRAAHASSGLLHERGVAGNLPSGEAYIVPYEGERKEASRTEGQVPVQFGDEVVFYKIQNNRATEVFSKGAASKMEIQKLRDEPAYGNIAEIGFGVLARFGVKPVGETLLDEKLGLHIAFGRSDHFGGAISPRDFKNPKNVIHIDRIYIPEVQPKVQVKEVVFRYPEQRQECVIRNGIYII